MFLYQIIGYDTELSVCDGFVFNPSYIQPAATTNTLRYKVLL